MSNPGGVPLPVPREFYIPLAQRHWSYFSVYSRVRCGRCKIEFTSLRKWEDHWSRRHGPRLEIRRTLTALQRGITSWTKIRDPARRAAAKYAIEYKRHSYQVGLWYRLHPDVARRMQKSKLSQTTAARKARKDRRKWRATVLHCGDCGSAVRRTEIKGYGVVSFCPIHGHGWSWNDRELFLVAAPPSQRAYATMRARGIVTRKALRAWATRRASGHVSEDVRKLWRTRRARYGPTGISREGTAAISAANSMKQRQKWTDPSYRFRQIAAIRKGIAGRKESP